MAGKGGAPYPTLMRLSYVLSLLFIALFRADAEDKPLNIMMGVSPITALRGENVIIPCNITNINNLKAIGVEWQKILENGTKNDVNIYNIGKITVVRNGSYMDVEEILKGNAELHLPNAQFSDDGEYTCSVTNTPRFGLGKNFLQVSAQPSVTPIPPVVEIELDAEKSVMCEVTGVYPVTVLIRWVQYSEQPPSCMALEKGTCTADPVINSDGTFNITSQLTLNPGKKDDGKKYSCIVTHRSLVDKIVRNFTLTVTEKKDNTGTIAGAVIGTVISTLLVVACVLIYWIRFKKDLPTLSDITGNDEQTDMSRTTLTCQMMNYRPDNITVSVRLRRRGQEEETIYTCSPRDSTAPGWLTRNGDHVILGVEEEQSLVNGAARQDERPLLLAVVSVVSRSKLGSFSCQCSLHITPSYDLDNEAVLSIHVTHQAQTLPISVRRVLNVIGVSPKLNAIMAPDHQVHNENVTLTCPINNFKPHPLSITWLKRDRNSQETELITWEPETQQQHNEIYTHHLKKDLDKDNSCYSYLSALNFKPTVKEDDGLTYICRTFHYATQKPAEEQLTMSLIAFPELDEIQKTQETVYVGEKLDLNCRIHSFYPANLTVTWYMEDRDLPLPSVTSDPLEEPNTGLYHVNSKASYTPTLKDLKKKFRCEAQQGNEKPRYITWTLRELYSEPSLGKIKMDPAEPEIGQPVILSCEFTNMYPGQCSIQWYQGLNRLTFNDDDKNIQQDLESGMFSGITKQNLKAAEHGTIILLEITHNTKTFKREYKISMKGFPELGEITSDPGKGDYGSPLTLCCNVTGCKPEDIKKVTWTSNGRPVVRGQEKESETGDLLLCKLTVKLTAEDYGRFYTCNVYHKDIEQPFTRNFSIKLPEKSPTLSDIIVRPVMVIVKQEASFQVTVSGFSPRDIQVKWYKGFSQFHSTAVTTTDPRIEEDNLYTLTSTLTYAPNQKDDKVSIRCEVTHSASRTIREKHYILGLTGRPDSGDGSSPSHSTPEIKFAISKIECLTKRPRVGDEITLVGHIDGCETEHAEFSWYKGIFPIDAEIDNQQDGSGCTSTITFTAEESDTDCTVRLEVIYNYQTKEENYNLRLVEM
ncbi:uncharacterized protein [Hyperolius riggenbachi]|uniref:uncharacterized protein n=1 Tax=Hyperolius riggenbachi TaxID=752182 RepID=UPI0035A26807